MYQHTGVLPLDNQSITFSINKRRHNCRKTEVHGTTWPQKFAGSYCLQAKPSILALRHEPDGLPTREVAVKDITSDSL